MTGVCTLPSTRQLSRRCVHVSCSDYVRLFLDLERPELDAGRRPTVELCGNLSAIYGPRQRLSERPVYSAKRSLVLEFHSGHVQRNHTGFIGRYRFVDTGPPCSCSMALVLIDDRKKLGKKELPSKQIAVKACAYQGPRKIEKSGGLI